MKPAIWIRVFGEPKPQPRPRAFGRKIGKQFVVRAYDPKTAEGWKSLIAQAAEKVLPKTPLSGPIRMHASFIFARPKSHFRSNGQLKASAPVWHTSTPDRDNLEKAVSDALTHIGFWEDDSRVCAGEVMKRYAKIDERPGAILLISELKVP